MASPRIALESVRGRSHLVYPRNLELLDWAEGQIFLTRTSGSKYSGDPVFSETDAGNQIGLAQDAKAQRFWKVAPSGQARIQLDVSFFASHSVFPIIPANTKRDRRVKSC